MTQVLEDHRYRPVGNLRQVFMCKDDEVLVVGAAGTGKSRACLEKLHLMALRYPGFRGLITRKTAASLGSTALVTYEEHVAAQHLASGEVKFFGGSAREAGAYRFGNGSRIIVGGMDKASKIMSSEYDAAYVQEATELDEDDWEAITTRLRNGKMPFQQVISDCNPQQPQHWLHQRCEKGRTTEVITTHEDNPRLWDGAEWTKEGRSYLSKLDALTGVRYLRLRKGIWAAAEGLVYEDFDPSVHLHKHIDHPPDNWERYLAVDFGYTNPFVCQWWVVDPDGRAYMYKEIYQTRGLVEDHAETIKAHFKDGYGKQEPRPRAVICDHDAEDRATLERHLQMPTLAARKTVTDGIEAVQARLRKQPDGRPRLYLCRDALLNRDPLLVDAKKPCSTIEEVTEYVWDTRVQPGTLNQREAPAKQNDHGMDAMRYLVAHLDLQPKPRVRVFYT